MEQSSVGPPFTNASIAEILARDWPDDGTSTNILPAFEGLNPSLDNPLPQEPCEKQPNCSTSESSNLHSNFKIKVKSLADLMEKREEGGATPALPTITEVIDLSSEEYEKKNPDPSSLYSSPRQKRKKYSAVSKTETKSKPATTSEGQSKSTTRKRNLNKLPLDEFTPRVRKLTKSTNLKTFPEKFQPKSQTRIHNYFKKSTEKSAIGYYDTFSQSKTSLTKRRTSEDHLNDSLGVTKNPDTPGKLQVSKNPDTPGKLVSITIVDSDSEKETVDTAPTSSKSPLRRSRRTKGREKENEACRSSTARPTKRRGATKRTTARRKLSLSLADKPTEPSTEIVPNAFGATLNLSGLSERNEQRVDNPSSVVECILSDPGESESSKNATTSNRNRTKKKNPVECPAYKVVEGTTFAVDAFRFGVIEHVTHYFLTHFHADHYVGLKKGFTKPVYLSPITARLVEAFIRVSPEYLHVMELNEPVMIKDVEVTALEANHCPGAVMFLFKFPNGLCTLHTGDFRASSEMEMEPIFWNNTIDTVYLDTTYISSKYAFKPQVESIDDVINFAGEFRLKHFGEKVMYVCGSYVIGKEKVWTALAEKYDLKVWTDGNRRKALEIIGDSNMLKYLHNDATVAQIHVLSMQHLSYDYLWTYLQTYSDHFDVLLAIRPSGWEKNSKPQLRGRVNIVGIEYSEHSSYNELRRFVRFLQPKKIISTVPSGSNLSRTAKIPKSWMNNTLRHCTIGYQSSLTNFVKISGSSNKKQSVNNNVSKDYKDDMAELEEAKRFDSCEDVRFLDTSSIEESCDLSKVNFMLNKSL